MQINTTRLNAIANNTTKVQGEPRPQDPQPHDPQQGTLENRIIDSLVTSPNFAEKAFSGLGAQSSMTISAQDGVVTIKNDGPSLGDKVGSVLGEVGNAGLGLMAKTSQEALRLMEADPAFSAKKIFEAAKGPIESGFDKANITPFLMPTLRGGMLIADTFKAKSMLQNKDASMAEKVIDVGHVVTDVIGMAGELGKVINIPLITPIAGTLAGIGLVGDLASVGFHAMGYITEQGQVNFDMKSDTLNSIFSSKAARAQERLAAKAQKQDPGQGHALFGK